MAQKNNNKKPKLLQGSMEYIIILSIVIIVALTAGVYYLSSLHNAKVGALNNIVSAQALSSNTLVLKLSTALPAGAQVKSINFTGVPPGTSISVSLENQTPVYSNGYPEYSFSVTDFLLTPLTYYNVSDLVYKVNGKTIVVPTITGEPMAIEGTNGYNGGGSTLPSGIIAYVPIIISNKQNMATPSPFQQMIQINEGNYASYIAYNGNFANFEFFTQSGSVLPAWIESNNSGTLTVWVKLPNGIPASSNTIIYLGFVSNTINLLSSSGTSGIGEAPQLSCPNPSATANCPTYGEYDDGSSVFNNYWNFAGTSLPSGWTQVYPYNGKPSWDVNNGLYVFPNSNFQNVYTTQEYALSPTGIVFDLYGNYSTNSLGVGFGMPYLTNVWCRNAWIGYDSSTNKFTLNIFDCNFGNSTDTSIAFSTAKQVWTFYSLGNGIILLNNYTNPTILENINAWGGFWNDNINTLNSPMGVSTGGSSTATVFVQWWRTRAVPPNGIMPSVSFGQIQSL